jgi:hypothetical protein
MATNKTPKKPVSERQLAANRANAQKSTGPASEAGKSVSKYNSLRHGLNSFLVCLPSEEKEMYEDIRAEYHAYFHPDNIVTRGMVDDLASTRWRLLRIIRAENALVREQMAKMRAHNEKTYDQLSIEVETAIAIKALADESKVSERMDRYEARLQRNFARVFKQLTQLQRDNPPSHDQRDNEKCQNEPIPINEHPVAPQPELAPEPQPIGRATAPNTIVLKRPPEAPAAHPPTLPASPNQTVAPAPVEPARLATAPHAVPAVPSTLLTMVAGRSMNPNPTETPLSTP